MVLVSADTINQSDRPWLFGVELQRDDPSDLLAIPVTGHGWAYPTGATPVTRCERRWGCLTTLAVVLGHGEAEAVPVGLTEPSP
jgi:hypothetical protein